MIVKVGPVTLRVSYRLVKKVGDTENYGFAIQQIVNTKIARTWTVYDLEAVKNFINHLVEKELLKEFDNL